MFPVFDREIDNLIVHFEI